MADSKPRDLTAEELTLSQSANVQPEGTAPMRTPPGTQLAIEDLDARGEAATAPMAGPEQ